MQDAALAQLLAHRVLSYRLIRFEKLRPARFPERWMNWSLALPQPIETLAGNRVAKSIARALRRRRGSRRR